MTTKKTTLLICFLILVSGRSTLASPWQFLLPGHNPPINSSKTETEESWYGVFPAINAKSEISSQKIKIKYEEAEEMEPMQNVIVSSGRVPLFLVKNFPNKTSTTIPSYFSSIFTLPEEKFKNSKTLLPGQSFLLKGSNPSCQLVAQGKITETGSQEDSFKSADHYKLELRCGSQKQVLLSIPQTNGSIPSLIWAGDLDQDGKVDLLLEGLGHYNGTSHQFFLSSAATQGELLHQVAKIVIVGP